MNINLTIGEGQQPKLSFAGTIKEFKLLTEESTARYHIKKLCEVLAAPSASPPVEVVSDASE